MEDGGAGPLAIIAFALYLVVLLAVGVAESRFGSKKR